MFGDTQTPTVLDATNPEIASGTFGGVLSDGTTVAIVDPSATAWNTTGRTQTVTALNVLEGYASWAKQIRVTDGTENGTTYYIRLYSS